MKFWIRYIKEKRLVLCLYGVTVFLLVAVGCLYHIENLYRLLYGVVKIGRASCRERVYEAV